MRLSFSICIICCVILSSCVSSYFKTPNDLYKTPATVYLDDSTVINGELTIQFEVEGDPKKVISVFHKETRKSETINADVVKCYKINNDLYFPKKIDFSYTNTFDLLFLKRLTSDSSKIQLYELYQTYKSTPSGQEQKLYYISLSGFSKFEVRSINDKKFFPDFEYKMSALVADCPSLAEKIKSKTKGYTINSSLVSETKRMEVFKRIIDEYNECR